MRTFSLSVAVCVLYYTSVTRMGDHILSFVELIIMYVHMNKPCHVLISIYMCIL